MGEKMGLFGGESKPRKHYVTLAQKISSNASQVALEAAVGEQGKIADEGGEGGVVIDISSLLMTGKDAAKVRQAFPVNFQNSDDRLQLRLRRLIP